MSRKRASFYILVNFYRRILLAFVILWFYNYPVIQVISCLAIIMFTTIFIVQNRVFEARIHQNFAVFNEIVIIITIYFLMMFTDFFILNSEIRYQLGKPMVYLTIANFLVNLLPVPYYITKWIILRCKRYK